MMIEEATEITMIEEDMKIVDMIKTLIKGGIIDNF